MDMSKEARVKREYARLKKVFAGLGKDEATVCEGLMVQAARLRVLLDDSREGATATVRRRINDAIAVSGLSLREFADRVGTSASRLSTYATGKVQPSAASVGSIGRSTPPTPRPSSTNCWIHDRSAPAGWFSVAPRSALGSMPSPRSTSSTLGWPPACSGSRLASSPASTRRL